MKVCAQHIIDLLPIVQSQFEADPVDGVIRTPDGECPICAVLNEIAGDHLSSTDVDLALKDMGLQKHRSINTFMCAVDGLEFDNGFYKAMRNRVTRALGWQ